MRGNWREGGAGHIRRVICPRRLKRQSAQQIFTPFGIPAFGRNYSYRLPCAAAAPHPTAEFRFIEPRPQTAPFLCCTVIFIALFYTRAPPESLMTSSRYPVRALTVSFSMIIMSLMGTWIAPRAASSLFTGPDGARWVAPFIVWMGCVCALYCACMPHIGRHCGGREAAWLGGVIAVLGGDDAVCGRTAFDLGTARTRSVPRSGMYQVGHGHRLV